MSGAGKEGFGDAELGLQRDSDAEQVPVVSSEPISETPTGRPLVDPTPAGRAAAGRPVQFQ